VSPDVTRALVVESDLTVFADERAVSGDRRNQRAQIFSRVEDGLVLDPPAWPVDERCSRHRRDVEPQLLSESRFLVQRAPFVVDRRLIAVGGDVPEAGHPIELTVDTKRRHVRIDLVDRGEAGVPRGAGVVSAERRGER